MSPGPVPKRSDQRRRRNVSDGPTLTKGASGGEPAVPEADPEWNRIAVEWFESLKDSGQSHYYEASDWATARYVAEAMSRNLNAGKFSAQLFQAVSSAMTELLTTEGARRRARVELERAMDDERPADPAVALMEDYRKAAGGGQ